MSSFTYGEGLFIAAAGEGESLATYRLGSFVEERVRLGGHKRTEQKLHLPEIFGDDAEDPGVLLRLGV